MNGSCRERCPTVASGRRWWAPLARIGTAGIETETKPTPLPAPAQGRDVYIYVRPANLPKDSVETPTEKTVERIEAIGGAVIAAMVAPTLEFLVYYDTGRVMDTHPGTTSKWLAPMTGFGYVAEHVGEIKGWEWALDGAEPIGGNWFRIRVKDGQSKKLRTRIQAVDEARIPPGNPVWPPGQAWINAAGAAPGSTKVKVTKKGGCAVAGGEGGAATDVLLLAALAWIARRRRRG